MKRDDNALDDFLRQKVDDAHFELKDAYWDRMSALLDEEDGKRKKPLFWRGLSVFFAVVLLGGAALLWPGSRKTEGEASVKPSGTSESVAVPAIPEEKKADATGTQKGMNTPNAHQDVRETPVQSTHTNAISTPPQTAPSVGVNSRSEHQTKKKKQQGVVTTSDTQAFVAESAGSNGLPEHATTNKDIAQAFPSTKQSESKQKKQTRKERKSKQEATRRTASASNAGEIAEPVMLSKDAHRNPEGMVDVRGQKMQVKEASVYKPLPDAAGKYHPRYVTGLQEYIPERIDCVQIITLTPAPSVMNTVPPVPQPETAPTDRKSLPFEFFAMAGCNANKGLHGNTTTQVPWGLAPFVSFGLQKKLSTKLSLATQVGFTYFNGLNLESKVTSYRYSFGVDSSSFTVSYRKWLQFYLPITLSYSWRKGHEVLVSAGMTYATDMNSLVKENANTSAYQANGYRNGFAAIDVMAQLGYQLQLNPRFAALLLWQQGFRDVTDNQYFNQTDVHRQSKLTLGIKYHFTRHGK